MEIDETMEEKLINEEYKIWKKNTPFLCVASKASSPCVLLTCLGLSDTTSS
jgi:hypothetical protein